MSSRLLVAIRNQFAGNGNLVGKATKQIIEATQAAVMVAVMTSAFMTTTIHSH